MKENTIQPIQIGFEKLFKMVAKTKKGELDKSKNKKEMSKKDKETKDE